jgi:O-antigen/teichoic acid export membrane protein
MNLKSEYIRTRIEKRPVLKKIIANTGWLTFEKILRMGLILLVNVLIARHLGPAEFGILNYAVSLSAFLGAFVYLGLSGLVIRDIVSDPTNKEVILGTTFFLKVTGSIISFAAISTIALYSHFGNLEFWILIIVGIGLFFKPFETIDLWFHSLTRSKFSVFSNSISSLLVSSTNVLLVLSGAGIICFALTASLEFVLAASGLLFYYVMDRQSALSWRFSFKKAKELLRQSWVLILSSFFSMIYLKIDQIMLRWMVGASEVGIYSVAVNFSEVWYFLPNAIALSVYPTLIEQKNKNHSSYLNKLQKTFDALFMIALVVAAAVTVSAKPVISLLYGNLYAKAGSLLMIHVWAGIFIFMRALFSRIVFIENLLVFSLITHLTGAILNVALNLLLIRRFSGYGAAVATLVSYTGASYISLFFSSKTRPFAMMMTRSFAAPFRIIDLLRNRASNA